MREVAALAHQPVVFKDDLSAADIHRVLIAPDILDARAVALGRPARRQSG